MYEKLSNRNFVDFNKEILFGEVGALISAPAVSYFASMITKDYNVISLSAVIGAIIGASIFWIAMRIYDKRRNKMPLENVAKDIAYFTPAAFLISLILYYPTLFLVSHYLLVEGVRVLYSVISSQVIAFLSFLIGVNAYRYVLAYRFGKVL